MSSFKDQTWNKRFASGGMGEEAEAVFEAYADEIGLGFTRYGLDRPKIQVHRLPPFIRYTPDYLMTSKLVEVQGFGNDQKFKLKADKMGCLMKWNDIHPVVLFAWDRTNQRRFIVPIMALYEVKTDVPTGFFDGDKLYYEYSADLLGVLGEQV